MKIDLVKIPEKGTSSNYLSNRSPLKKIPFSKLPVGSIKPGGWLKHQLELMKDGMIGNLPKISEFLKPDNGWLGEDSFDWNDPSRGWEEQPYWLRGFYDLAVITKSDNLIKQANQWINAVLQSQDDDGYFGPESNKYVTGKYNHRIVDLWPHMIMLDVIISYYEYTGDNKVIIFMKNFFKFCLGLPEENFIPKIIPKQYRDKTFKELYNSGKPRVQTKRSGDMLPHIYWLYNQIGENWLLELAKRFYNHIMPPVSEWLDNHIVNFTQRFRYPGNFYIQSGEKWHLDQSEYWYEQHMSTWGQQPRGIFGADELIRTGSVDPRQAFETCGMVEFAKSFYILGRITGDPVYADRCEDIMLNHFPASQTPELKGLHYLTASNQPQLDASGIHEYSNKKTMISYSPYSCYRCCQHNVSMGWPSYVKNLWQATSDNGLAAWMYASSTVNAKVGSKSEEVEITTETFYPFDSEVLMFFNMQEPVSFPIYLRIPRWCDNFEVKVNDTRLDKSFQPGMYVRIERNWMPEDKIRIKMPMDLIVTRWPRNGSATVDRGPLSYSVKIKEKWKQYGGTKEWPEWEIFPNSAWNYGLLIDRNNKLKSYELEFGNTGCKHPWTIDNAPIRIKVSSKKIPGWRLENNTVQELPVSPVLSDKNEEKVTFVPLGCARLRISCFPVINI